MKAVHPVLVVLFVILLLLPGLAFIGLHLILPSDPSNPVVNFQEIRSEGFIVQPLSPVPQGLQGGDIVTGIQERGVNQYLNDSFSLRKFARPVQQIEYTVLRAGQALSFVVTLKAYPLAQSLKRNWSIFFYLGYLGLVSLLVFILRPRLAAARLFLVASYVLISNTQVYFQGLKVDDLLYRWPVILYLGETVIMYGIMLAALVHLALIFPKRHPFLERHPRWVWWIYLGVWLPLLLYVAARWKSVLSPAGHLVLIVQGSTMMSVFYFPLLLFSTWSSYHTGNAQEKRQVRWLWWSLLISLVPYLAFNVVPSILGMNVEIARTLLGLLWCTIPTSFAIAVLRERLFDIDVIIHRTLIYTALTATMGVIYFICVLSLQEGFQALTGHQSPLATVLSTLVIVALFFPLRRRIQNDIDRRFYRRKYDAEKILERFSLTVRNEVELEKLTARLLDVVKETMEPQSSSLWICKD